MVNSKHNYGHFHFVHNFELLIFFLDLPVRLQVQTASCIRVPLITAHWQFSQGKWWTVGFCVTWSRLL